MNENERDLFKEIIAANIIKGSAAMTAQNRADLKKVVAEMDCAAAREYEADKVKVREIKSRRTP